MDKFEIRRKIDENNRRIETLLRPDIFVLNREIRSLMEDNKNLQAQCSHDFVDGICVYCDLEEK